MSCRHGLCDIFLTLIRPTPIPTLFPYTTLFRSVSDPAARAKWEDITPLARNEWICWVIYVKKPETRRQHVERVRTELDRKSTRLNSSHRCISYAVFCLKKKKKCRINTKAPQQRH